MNSSNPILKNSLQRLCPSCNIIVNINQHVCKCGYRLFDVKRKAQQESQAQANIKRSEKKKHVHGVLDELHKTVQDLQHQKKLKEIEEEITRLRAIYDSQNNNPKRRTIRYIGTSSRKSRALGTPSNPFPCSREVMKPPVPVVDVIPQNINDGDDVEELVEEHNKELTTEELQALQKEQQEDPAEEVSPVEEDEAVANVPSAEVKKVCQMWEEMQTFIEKTHPEKAVVGRYINIFNDNVMPHYRDILQRRKKQTSMDRFVVRTSSSEPQPGPSGMQAKRARECTPERSSLFDVIMEGDSPLKH
ncbi:uncharacterized protein [Procambarus clarkii]|uniref:uncharacterized protein isoform X2 n=1 Tax=Procambarus clarkii TaxID=6728 RepID=UPI003742B866